MAGIYGTLTGQPLTAGQDRKRNVGAFRKADGVLPSTTIGYGLEVQINTSDSSEVNVSAGVALVGGCICEFNTQQTVNATSGTGYRYIVVRADTTEAEPVITITSNPQEDDLLTGAGTRDFVLARVYLSSSAFNNLTTETYRDANLLGSEKYYTQEEVDAIIENVTDDLTGAYSGGTTLYDDGGIILNDAGNLQQSYTDFKLIRVNYTFNNAVSGYFDFNVIDGKSFYKGIISTGTDGGEESDLFVADVLVYFPNVTAVKNAKARVMKIVSESGNNLVTNYKAMLTIESIVGYN